MGTSSPDTVSLAGHVDATAGDPVEVDDDGDAAALAVELLLEERDGVINSGADIGIVDDAPPSSSDRRDHQVLGDLYLRVGPLARRGLSPRQILRRGDAGA